MSDFSFKEWIEQVTGVSQADEDSVPIEWNNRDRYVFKNTYEYILDNQRTFTHPLQPKMPQEWWKTIAWNAAWIAAEQSFNYGVEQANG